MKKPPSTTPPGCLLSWVSGLNFANSLEQNYTAFKKVPLDTLWKVCTQKQVSPWKFERSQRPVF